MYWRDPLYGVYKFPSFISDIFKTKGFNRLRGISQDVLPNEFLPFRVPSRHEHCFGVCCLMFEVLEKNPELKDLEILLPVAALLHDAGNPPLSHLSERFLFRATGKDGESFLTDIIRDSDLGGMLKKIGLDADEVVRFVTGNKKPLSDVLNGSMDIDNLDNIFRYPVATGLDRYGFNPVKIASSFRWNGDGWALLDDCREETRKWQKTRKSVYQTIYGAPHLNAAMMISRALHLAFAKDEIPVSFFQLGDAEAITFLQEKCNPQTRKLVIAASQKEWYQEIYEFSTDKPSVNLYALASSPMEGRAEVADLICKRLVVSPETICVYVGEGRDHRRIKLPFIAKDGSRSYDNGDHPTIYRLKVYAPPELCHRELTIARVIQDVIR